MSIAKYGLACLVHEDETDGACIICGGDNAYQCRGDRIIGKKEIIMTRIYDGTKLVEISMQAWTGNEYAPDWSNDFYEVGGLPYDGEKGAYIVNDVDYCLSQANDWANREGDYSDNVVFCYDEDDSKKERAVFVREVEV